MEDPGLNIDFIVQHWVTMADNDYETMLDIYKSKRYNWTLFIGHLVIEKYLKACYVKINKQHPIPTHNLLKLALISNMVLSEEMQTDLATISAFNIKGRYDDYKMEFFKMCTPEYTRLWVEKISNIATWIKKEHLK